MNAILLIIDSLDYSRCQASAVELLPNISRRAEGGLVYKNIFSQSPYTEAATIALYCGQNTLDYHGYIERFNNVKTTLMEAVEKAGYETFFNSFQPQCFPSSLRRGVNHIRYNRGFDNPALWVYRFEHYSKKYNNGDFDETDFRQLMRILSDNFTEWIRFLDDLIRDDESVEMIKLLNKKYDANTIKKQVIKEEQSYLNDPKAYIVEVLKKGKNHILFSIPYFEQIDYDLSNTTVEYYNGEIRKLVKKVRRLNFFQNIFFNQDVMPAGLKAIKHLLNGNKQLYNQEISLIRNALLMGNNNKKYGKECHSLKGQPSFNEHINNFFSWLDSRNNQKRPYFATIHVDDIHYPEMFFSYDSDNITVLNEEVKTAKDCLKKRRINSKGTVSLDLSLRYADLKVEELIKGLETRGEIDNTILFITADHGFSYSGFPIRNKFVNTFYLENFKIPFYIIGKTEKSGAELSLGSSVDIPPTICDILGIDIPSSFAGTSLLKERKGDILTIEYCGGGCPDINYRQLMIAAFDQRYMVAGLFKLSDCFGEEHITEIYDLKNDPLQRKNLKGKISLSVLSEYISAIRSRFEKINQTNNEVLDTF